jgi:hypothetical protein
VAEERTAKDISALESATRALVLLGDGDGQIHRERGFHDPLADLGAADGQRVHIFNVQRIQRGVDLVVEAALRQEIAVGIGRRSKAARHTNTGTGQLADHFAKRRILAADLFNVGHAQLFKRDNEGFHAESFQGVNLRSM